MGVSRKQSTPKFPKNKHFFPPFPKHFLPYSFEIRPFALLPTKYSHEDACKDLQPTILLKHEYHKFISNVLREVFRKTPSAYAKLMQVHSKCAMTVVA